MSELNISQISNCAYPSELSIEGEKNVIKSEIERKSHSIRNKTRSEKRQQENIQNFVKAQKLENLQNI